MDWISENQSTVALTWVAVVFATAVLWLTTKGESEAAVDFEVPLPKQCEPGWQGEVLQEPSLKVRFFLYFPDLFSIYPLYLGFSFFPLWSFEKDMSNIKFSKKDITKSLGRISDTT